MATRPAIVFLVFAGCAPSPQAGFSLLAEQSLVFAGQRSWQNVSGQVLFGTSAAGLETSRGGTCFSLGGEVTATLNGLTTLTRTSGPCVQNGLEDRWVVPALTSDQPDLNLVLTDGTHVARAVIVNVITQPSTRLSELVFHGSRPTPIELGFPTSELDVHYVGRDGMEWTQTVAGTFVSAPVGAGLGQVTLSGRAVIQAVTCNGFASCRAEVPFSLGVAARYE